MASEQPDYRFVDEARRAQAKTAMEAGLGCILKTQVVQNGKLTVWCAQHDPITLEAAPARAFEVASLSGWESADIVRFLMSIEPPTPEIKNSIESAIAWFEKSKITGFEVVVKSQRSRRPRFRAQSQSRCGAAVGAFLRTRHQPPAFRDARTVKVFYNLAELDQSGPGNGYNWYVTQPASLLEKDYPKWRAQWNPTREVSALADADKLAARDAEIRG